jgi:glutamate-1-semialdehyde aminotransferase
MTALLAVLEFTDFAIIAGIVVIFAGGAAYTARQDINLGRLERLTRDLQQKLDALLKHQGIEMPTAPPSDMSLELQFMAKDPHQMIDAIKLYRKENPGTGLAEAKQRIEKFYKTGR